MGDLGKAWRNMTVYRMPSGGLFIHGPCALFEPQVRLAVPLHARVCLCALVCTCTCVSCGVWLLSNACGSLADNPARVHGRVQTCFAVVRGRAPNPNGHLVSF